MAAEIRQDASAAFPYAKGTIQKDLFCIIVGV